jgi:hypothetical protein
VTSSVVALINCAGAAEIVMAGADVPVSRFERRLLGAWGGRGTELTIIDDQGRVVMSNCAHALSGDLLSDPDHSTVGRPSRRAVARRRRRSPWRATDPARLTSPLPSSLVEFVAGSGG